MGRSLQDGETGENCVRETHIWNKIPDKTQKNKSTVIKKRICVRKKCIPQMQKESRCRKVEGLRVVKTIEKKKKENLLSGLGYNCALLTN